MNINVFVLKIYTREMPYGVKQPAEERFWSFVDKGDENECWTWTGTKRRGYGQIWIDGKLIFSHRYSYVKHNPYGLSFDDIEGCVVCHACDNPACVNPAHLFVGTTQDNIIDRDVKGRQVTAKGENNARAKLQDFHIREIRHAYAAGGVTQQNLADEFGVHRSVITNIINNKAWKHITPQSPSPETESPHPN